jgi:uracil-DNA glycosylase
MKTARMQELPKALASAEERRVRLALLDAPHVASLTRFVADLRAQMGPEYCIPNLDPLDGGTNAGCLFLLEAPGPNAIASGFVSRDNPDETAKNFFLLNQEASIVRTRTVTWNVVPWYVGSGTRIRAANPSDIRLALPALTKLLQLLTRLRIIALIGRRRLQHANQ